MKKIILSGFIGVVIGLIAAFLFARFLPRPGPTVAKVTENPTPAQRQAATVSIRRESQGELTGQLKLPRHTQHDISVQVALTPPNPEQPVNLADEPSPASPAPIYALFPGDQISGPLSGQVHSNYYDARTGRLVGEGDHPITGQVTLTAGEDSLQVTATFNDIAETAVYAPEREQHWNIYGGFGTDLNQVGLFGEIQYLPLWYNGFYMGVGIEYDGKTKLQLIAGKRF